MENAVHIFQKFLLFIKFSSLYFYYDQHELIEHVSKTSVLLVLYKLNCRKLYCDNFVLSRKSTNDLSFKNS